MNHEYPPALSEYGKIRNPSSKSDFISCLATVAEEEEKDGEDIGYESFEAPSVDAYVVVGPTLVHMITQKSHVIM